MTGKLSTLQRVGSVAHATRTAFVSDVRYSIRNDRVTVFYIYAYIVSVAALLLLLLLPAWSGIGPVAKVSFFAVTVLLVVPAAALMLGLLSLLFYSFFDAIIDETYESSYVRMNLRRALRSLRRRKFPLFAGHQIPFFGHRDMPYRSGPGFVDRADRAPRPVFVRFEWLRDAVTASLKFSATATDNAGGMGPWTRLLSARVRRRQVSAIKRMQAAYRDLLPHIVAEYAHSLGRSTSLDQTASVWPLPDKVFSVYSLRVLEEYVPFVGSLADRDRRPAPLVKLVFSPAWVCAMVMSMEVKHYRPYWNGLDVITTASGRDIRSERSIVCVPLKGADREIVEKLYDHAGLLGDLENLVEVSLTI